MLIRNTSLLIVLARVGYKRLLENPALLPVLARTPALLLVLDRNTSSVVVVG